MKKIFVYGLLIAFTVFSDTPAFGEAGSTAEVQQDTYGDQLGTVSFPTSCNEAARGHVERGLALLHHMTYEAARVAFATATEADPECAMGYWGQALSIIHPLWSDPPSEATFQKGQALLNQAKIRGQKSEREHAYIEAVEAYYAKGWNLNETANLASFEQAWETIYRNFPEDSEGASLYALAHLATADPGDKTYAKQKHAGTVAEKVLTRIPDHPGAHHYIIHAYDYPPLAEKALKVARSYGDIAPDIPHALHMPSHIFTRLGLWQESITMNRRSAAAALKHPVGGGRSPETPRGRSDLVAQSPRP
jgi:hypothetical protein